MTFNSSVVTAPCALSTANPSSSQTLDERESAFSFPLLVTHGLLEAGVGISSTEVAREAILTVSVPETMGVTEVGGVTKGPFPMTRTVLFLRLDSCLSFFVLILAYIFLLNLVVIFEKGKHLLREKKKKKKKTSTMKSALTNVTLTLFSFNFKVTQDEGRRLRP